MKPPDYLLCRVGELDIHGFMDEAAITRALEPPVGDPVKLQEILELDMKLLELTVDHFISHYSQCLASTCEMCNCYTLDFIQNFSADLST